MVTQVGTDYYIAKLAHKCFNTFAYLEIITRGAPVDGHHYGAFADLLSEYLFNLRPELPGQGGYIDQIIGQRFFEKRGS